MSDDKKVFEVRPALFSAGRVSITYEAFQGLKEAGLNPADVIGRHTRGDFCGAPVKWMQKNWDRLHGQESYPVMSVYDLSPGAEKVCVATEADFSKTSISLWPSGDRNAPLLPVHMAEEMYTREMDSKPGVKAHELMNRMGEGTRSKERSAQEGKDAQGVASVKSRGEVSLERSARAARNCYPTVNFKAER